MMRVYTFLFFFFCLQTGFSQLTVVNTIDSVYTINESGQLCAYKNFGQICGSGYIDQPFSSAVFNNELYYITINSDLYRMPLNRPGACIKLTSFPRNGVGTTSVNALAIDKNGIVYGADISNFQLYVYNPYTDVFKWKGQLAEAPGGDMIFYKNKLLMAGISGNIYEVNIDTPSASKIYMSVPGHVFYGLISVPYDCNKNKYYGLKPVYPPAATEMYELDLDNKQLVGYICTLPFLVYDAGSNVDNGNTLGVTIDSIHITPQCGKNNAASVKVMAGTASSGGLTYTIDGMLTNNTGIFNSLTTGQHTLSVKNERNCIKDTTFTILPSLSSTASFITTNPLNCNTQNGSIIIQATSGYLPLSYSVDGSPFQPNPQFNNMGSGGHAIKVRDAKGCQIDTVLYLQYQSLPTFLSSFTVVPTICNTKSGNIKINLSPAVNPGDITTLLNNGSLSSSLSYSQLEQGEYLVSVIYQNSCRYDTVINILKLINPEPAVSIDVSHQLCLINNGTINVNATGLYGPYSFSLNGSSYKPVSAYTNLAPGVYTISIADKNTCTIDTSITILSYNKMPVSFTIDSLNPTCLALNNGTITVNVTGQQSPYRFKLNNKTYSNGEKAVDLPAGKYAVAILNKDLCVVDSAIVNLDLEILPGCDFIHIPSAFTPNNDGLNDKFRIVTGGAIDSFRLTVYNRWGQQLFTTTDKSKGWDGTFNGTAQVPGVYVWTISYKTVTDEKLKQLKGFISLLR